MGCDGRPSGTSANLRPITGTVRLTLRGGDGWAALLRDGADAFVLRRVRAGEPVDIEWREEVDRPRAWRLKFGPSRHPGYVLGILPDGPVAPPFTLRDRDRLHDPAVALALVHFAVPLDGRRDLDVDLGEIAPLEVEVVDPDGKPLAGMPVLGVRTPRYLFLDGYERVGIDEMHASWPMEFWIQERPAKRPRPADQVVTRRTDERGVARIDGFVGWVGVPETAEAWVRPRQILASAPDRRVRVVVVKAPARVRGTVEGLPARDHYVTQRGLIARGRWPMPPGAPPSPWEEKLWFPSGSDFDFVTPCREVEIQAVSSVHRIAEGGTIGGLKPGEVRRHAVKLEERPHPTIEGEVRLEDRGVFAREFCGIDLFEPGSAGDLLQSVGPRGSAGVPASGRVPFLFHVPDEGPYTLVVRTGGYPWAVLPAVKAPSEGLQIRLAPEPRAVSCRMTVRTAEGRRVDGFVVGSWPHRDLLSTFAAGGDALGKPGLNTFIVHAEEGAAVLRDVRIEEGRPADLEAALGPGCTLRGRLVDGTGAALAGEWVHVSWPGYLRMPHAYRWLADLTQADGTFEIPRVPPGEWRLYLRGSGVALGDAFLIPEAERERDVGPRRAGDGGK